MKKLSTLLLILFVSINFFAQNNFIKEQKRYSRVRTAFKQKDSIVKANLAQNHIKTNELNILIVVFKEESKLDIYAKSKNTSSYKKIKTYTICAKSGVLGPKRAQGDMQVPEGFYYINRFNPYSNFYLSLGINYPNASDKKKSNAQDLGGDIFIHGDCVTIGCMPITDDKIKEIYLYAVYAKNNGQSKIPVYIFPFKMDDENFKRYKEKFKKNKELISFWTNIKTGYDRFMLEKTPLKYTINKNGDYVFR